MRGFGPWILGQDIMLNLIYDKKHIQLYYETYILYVLNNLGD